MINGRSRIRARSYREPIYVYHIALHCTVQIIATSNVCISGRIGGLCWDDTCARHNSYRRSKNNYNNHSIVSSGCLFSLFASQFRIGDLDLSLIVSYPRYLANRRLKVFSEWVWKRVSPPTVVAQRSEEARDLEKHKRGTTREDAAGGGQGDKQKKVLREWQRLVSPQSLSRFASRSPRGLYSI